MKALNSRDKRAIVITVVFAVCSGFYWVADRWWTVHQELRQAQMGVENLLGNAVGSEKDARRLLQSVPAFAAPATMDEQRLRFERQVFQQVGQAGIGGALKYMGRGKTYKPLDMKVLTLQCRGTGELYKVMRFLADSARNPYLFSIETFQFECQDDPAKVAYTVELSTLSQ